MNKCFFLFGVDIDDITKIKFIVISSLFVTFNEDSVNICLIRDIDHSIDSVDIKKIRYILTAANKNISFSKHLNNIEHIQQNQTIDFSIYNIIADCVYVVDVNNQEYNNDNFIFKMSYYKMPGINSYNVSLPNFVFNKSYLDNKLTNL